jgi:outer membrane protein TolC
MRYVAFASGLCLVLMASPLAWSVSAQSARPAELTGALLGLQNEFPDSLHRITPELLRLQQQLIESVRIELVGVRDEERVGQRTLKEIVALEQVYFRELESLRVMTARWNNKSISERELLKIRIAVRSEALTVLQRHAAQVQSRFVTGEVTRVDLEGAKAAMLKAEIMLEALKNAAGEKRARPSVPDTVAPTSK